jgi:hypothetical protein
VALRCAELRAGHCAAHVVVCSDAHAIVRSVNVDCSGLVDENVSSFSPLKYAALCQQVRQNKGEGLTFSTCCYSWNALHIDELVLQPQVIWPELHAEICNFRHALSFSIFQS